MLIFLMMHLQNALFGIDISTYEKRRVPAAEYNILDHGASDGIRFYDDYEVGTSFSRLLCYIFSLLHMPSFFL